MFCLFSFCQKLNCKSELRKLLKTSLLAPSFLYNAMLQIEDADIRTLIFVC